MPSRFMISAIAVPSFMTVSPLKLQAGSVRRFAPVGTGFSRPVKRRRRFGGEVLICVLQYRAVGRPEPVKGDRLPRLAAAAEHGRHQAEQKDLHAAIGSGRQLSAPRLLDLVTQEADIVGTRFTLLRGHVRILRKTPIGQPWAGSAQPMVNFLSRMNTGCRLRPMPGRSV